MKKMKKILALVLVLGFAFSFAACGNKTNSDTSSSEQSNSTVTATEAPTEEPKSDLVVAGIVFQEDQFMKLQTIGFQKAAEAAGVKCLTANTNGDVAKEAEVINTYVAQKLSGIAISPINQDSSIAALKKADEQGVKIAISNMDLTNSSFAVGGFTSDNKNLGATTGKAAAKFIQEKLGGKANIAILQFKSALPQQSNDRVNGFLEEVKKLNPDVKVVADQDAWLQDKAVATAGDMLTANKDINIIFGANDGGTIGSVMAVKNAGLAGKCFVYGIDAGEQQTAMLRDQDNVLQAVTGQDPYTIGYNTMDILIRTLKGEDTSASKGKVVIVPGLLVSRDDPAGIDAFEADLKAKIGQ